VSIYTTDPTKALRSAVELVRGNPGAVEALEAEDAARAKAAADAAKAKAAAEQKVAAALEARTAQLVADWHELEKAAIRDAAARLAKEQLDRQYGVVPAKLAAMSPAPARLTPRHVDASLARLTGSAPVGYDPEGRSAAVLRSAQAAAAAEALEAARPPTAVDDVDARIAERRAQMEAQRVAGIAKRKKDAGIGKASK
jgi:hypothetical protein